MVEEESCESNILLRGPSHSSVDAYVHTHARTDVPTYRGSLSHTHMHAGTRKMKTNNSQTIATGISQNQKNLRIRHLKTIVKKTIVFILRVFELAEI